MGKKTNELVDLAKSKPKKKKENNMKKTIILTAVATVAIIALFVTTFALGVKWANSQHVSVQQKAEQIAKQQAVVSRVESKQ